MSVTKIEIGKDLLKLLIHRGLIEITQGQLADAQITSVMATVSSGAWISVHGLEITLVHENVAAVAGAKAPSPAPTEVIAPVSPPRGRPMLRIVD